MAEAQDSKLIMVDGMMQNAATKGYGIGGVDGLHHNEAGWDNTTVGMASSVFDNLLTQNGVRTNDPNYIGALEPIRAGKFIVKWLKVPSFFSLTAVKYLKFFLENAVKSVSGLSDNSISESGSITFGADGQEMSFPGQLKQNNKTVSLSTITCTGDGLGKLMRYWMYGITDPATQVHHMYGKNLRFIRPNYCGTLMYIFMGPTCRPGDIEYACIWHEVWPTSGNGIAKFESQEIGSDSAVGEQTVDLTGIFQDGPEVNILAKYIVAGVGLAGQSYFDQMLPAYMYSKYIQPLQKPDEGEGILLKKAINLTQENKLSSAEVYQGIFGENSTRSTILNNHGVNLKSLPSNNDTIANNALTKAVEEFNVGNTSHTFADQAAHDQKVSDAQS